MTGAGFFALGACVIATILLVYLAWHGEDGVGFTLLVALAAGCVAWLETGDNALEREAERDRRAAEQKANRERPRVIREFDGCKVYQFEAEGRDRFVTVCKDKVTTTWGRTESCGKNCFRTVDESIETVKEKQ